MEMEFPGFSLQEKPCWAVCTPTHLSRHPMYAVGEGCQQCTQGVCSQEEGAHGEGFTCVIQASETGTSLR